MYGAGIELHSICAGLGNPGGSQHHRHQCCAQILAEGAGNREDSGGGAAARAWCIAQHFTIVGALEEVEAANEGAPQDIGDGSMCALRQASNTRPSVNTSKPQVDSNADE